MLPIKEIDLALPKKGLIYEIGSGYGSISTNLGMYSSARKLIGIDIDKYKIEKAINLSVLKNVKFEYGDALNYVFLQCNGVILSDFLHHINYDQQVIILKKISQKIVKKGILIIKEIDRSDKVRMLMSRLWDFIFYPKDKIYYRTKEEIILILTKLGFSVKYKKTILWFPGSTCLFICQKK